MARGKVRCKGKNLNSTSCRNWALRGSYYCQLHQGQESKADRDLQKETDNLVSIILICIVVFGLAFSSCLGCEGEFIDWLGR